MDQLWMEHPDLPGRKVLVTTTQFEVHKLSGWVETEAPDIIRPSSVNVVFGISPEPPPAPSATRARFVPDAEKAARAAEAAAAVTPGEKPKPATELPPNLNRDNPHN